MYLTTDKPVLNSQVQQYTNINTKSYKWGEGQAEENMLSPRFPWAKVGNRLSDKIL